MNEVSVNRATTVVEVPVRDSVAVATYGGKTVWLEASKLSPEMLGTLIYEGSLRILRDGIGAKDLSDAERIAKLEKRLAAWKAGSFRVLERGDALASLMRECYVREVQAKHPGATQRAVEKQMRETVKATLGEDVNATFENFLRAVAKGVAEREGKEEVEVAELLIEKYEAAARELMAERERAKEATQGMTLDLSSVALG